MKGATVVFGALAIAAVFGGGLYAGSCGNVDDTALHDSLAVETAHRRQLEHANDSVAAALNMQQREVNRLRREAVTATIAAGYASGVSQAYADTVRALSDTLLRVKTAGGRDTVVTVPPAVTAKMRADSATIAAERLSALRWHATADTTAEALRTARSEIDLLHGIVGSADKQADLRETIAYRAGLSRGRKQGLVVGVLLTAGTVYGGAKVLKAGMRVTLR